VLAFLLIILFKKLDSAFLLLALFLEKNYARQVPDVCCLFCSNAIAIVSQRWRYVALKLNAIFVLFGSCGQWEKLRAFY